MKDKEFRKLYLKEFQKLAGAGFSQPDGKRTEFTLEALLKLDVEFRHVRIQTSDGQSSRPCKMSDMYDLLIGNASDRLPPKELGGLWWMLKHGKFWYDHEYSRFRGTGMSEAVWRPIVKAINDHLLPFIAQHTGIDPSRFDGLVEAGDSTIVYQRYHSKVEDFPVLIESWKQRGDDIHAQSCVFCKTDIAHLHEDEVVQLVKKEFKLAQEASTTIGHQTDYLLVNFNFESSDDCF